MVKWIKIVTDIFDDEKIKFISTMPNGDEMIVIWFRILCLCGKCNQNGFLMFTSKLSYTDEMLASIFGKDIKSIQIALRMFEQLEMIEINEYNQICVTNWEKHQSLDKIEAKKEYDRQYQAKKRKEKAMLLQSRTTNRIESDDNRIVDKDIEEEKEKDIKSNKKFQKPTVEEIQSYITENNYSVDAERFWNYYESVGWKVGGKSPMKNWQASVRMWESKNKSNPDKKKQIVPQWQKGSEESASQDELDNLKALLGNL